MEDFVPESKYEQYLVSKAVKMRIPLSGTFELLPLCNLNCTMCYVRMSPEEQQRQGKIMTGSEWLKIAKEAVDNGLVFLLLTGGEPLLHPDFVQIYKGIIKMGVYISINTNGTLITEEIADLFKKYPPRRVNITLYGTSDEKYLEVCRNPKGFTQVMNAISLLKERNIPLKLNSTLNKLNVNELHDVIEIAKSLSLRIDIPYYLFPQNRKINKSEDPLRLSPSEAAKLRFEVVKYGFDYNEDDIASDIKRAIDEIELFNLPYQEAPKGFWCASGFQAFWVNWLGNVTSCGLLENPCVNIKDKSFSEMWKQLQKTTQTIQLSHVCFNCKYFKICSPCAASMYAESHDFEVVPEYRCEITKEYVKLIKSYLDDYLNSHNFE